MIRIRNKLVLAFAFAATLAAAGCAYPPPPTVMTPLTDQTTYGYTEKQTGPDTYEVNFLGPQVLTRDIVPAWVEHAADVARQTNSDFALWRAAQIAAQNHADTFVVTKATPELHYYIVGRDYRDVPNAVYDNITPLKAGYDTGTYFRPQTTLQVAFGSKADGTKYDTKKVVDEMTAKYPEGSIALVPERYYYYFGPTAFIQDYKGPKPAPYGEGSPYQAPAPQPTLGTGPPGYKAYHGIQY